MSLNPPSLTVLRGRDDIYVFLCASFFTVMFFCWRMRGEKRFRFIYKKRFMSISMYHRHPVHSPPCLSPKHPLKCMWKYINRRRELNSFFMLFFWPKVKLNKNLFLSFSSEIFARLGRRVTVSSTHKLSFIITQSKSITQRAYVIGLHRTFYKPPFSAERTTENKKNYATSLSNTGVEKLKALASSTAKNRIIR